LDNLRKFLATCNTKTYKKGDVILHQDVEPAYTYIIKEGTIKTYNITTKGEEKPISFSVADDIFPLGWIFDKISKSQYYYESLTDCELYTIPKDELVTFIKDNPKAMFQVLNRCVWEMLIHQMHINALEQSKASEKVLHTLHYLALCFGHDLRTDMVEISLPITQQVVANFTGLTRETISAELKKLAQQKIVFYRNRNYVVLTDRLNKLLDDEYERRLIR
jgi:CRP-like cAMP-binding protein